MRTLRTLLGKREIQKVAPSTVDKMFQTGHSNYPNNCYLHSAN